MAAVVTSPRAPTRQGQPITLTPITSFWYN